MLIFGTALLALMAGALFYAARIPTQVQAPAPAVTEPRRLEVVTHPSFALPDMEGTTREFAEWDGSHRLLNFWATWCAPCREEMPSMERLRQAMQGKPFTVLAVNLAEPEPQVREFLRSMPLGFPILLDAEMAVTRAWKVRQLPASFLVGPDGRIRYSYIGDLDWSRESVRQTISGLLPR